MEEKSEEIQIEHLDGEVRRMVGKILLDREDGGRNNGTGYAVPLEEYLIGLTAVQIPDGYPKEAVKAQAILARTALYREMDGADSIEESALDMDYLEPEQIESRV